MVIGSGDIASVLTGLRQDFLYFASGVSNSKETRKSEYKREVNLLLQQDRNKHIVYFSSLAIFELDTPYIQHKKRMEAIIKKYFKRHTIVRIGNISWGSNPNTLINYLKAHKDASIQDVYRYIVNKEEFLYWMERIPDWSCEMSIPGRRLLVKEIVEEINAGIL